MTDERQRDEAAHSYRLNQVEEFLRPLIESGELERGVDEDGKVVYYRIDKSDEDSKADEG